MKALDVWISLMSGRSVRRRSLFCKNRKTPNLDIKSSTFQQLSNYEAEIPNKKNTTEICQGYKGEAKVEICSDAEEPYSLSGCGPKRCIEPTPRASKYYKLEVRKGIETNRFHKNKELANLKKRGL